MDELEQELTESLQSLSARKLHEIQRQARVSVGLLDRGEWPDQDKEELRRLLHRQAYHQRVTALREEYLTVCKVVADIMRRRAQDTPGLPKGEALEALLYGEARDPEDEGKTGPLPGSEPLSGIP